MQLHEYDQAVQNTNLMGENVLYHLLGLISEVAEVAEHVNVTSNPVLKDYLEMVQESGKIAAQIKRQLRDHGVVINTDIDYVKALAEMRDIYWYVSSLNTALHSTSELTIVGMIDKLQSRKERGTLHGSGDNR